MENVFVNHEQIEPLHLLHVQRASNASNASSYVPSLFYGVFEATEIADTFFNPIGWSKGQVFINGYNVGRYWPAIGPQVTLYVPKFYLKPVNLVIMLEMDGPGNCNDQHMLQCSISFADVPLLNKTQVNALSTHKFTTDAYSMGH